MWSLVRASCCEGRKGPFISLRARSFQRLHTVPRRPVRAPVWRHIYDSAAASRAREVTWTWHRAAWLSRRRGLLFVQAMIAPQRLSELHKASRRPIIQAKPNRAN
jgi:hypothetical protein